MSVKGTMLPMPVHLTKEQFLAVLDDIRDLVVADDSFEGSLSYELPWNTRCDPVNEDDPSDGFRVRASYRTGNSMGQGGMRMLGEMREVPDADT